MKALAIDTSTNLLSIAAQNEDVFASANFLAPMRQSENLLPFVDSILKKINLECGDLQFVAISSGPGSFTGLRLAYSAAKAIAFAHKTPIFAESCVFTRAWQFRFCKNPILPVLDAKKSRWYCGIFQGGKEVLPPSDLTAERIIQKCDEIFDGNDIFVVGSDARKFIGELQNHPKSASFAPTFDDFSPAKNLLEICGEKFSNGEPPLPPDAAPNYIRASDAEIAHE